MMTALTILFGSTSLVLLYLLYTREEAIRRKVDSLKREKEAMEASLRAQQGEVAQQQAKLFDSMIEGLLILDANSRIRLVNASCRRLFQLRGEVAGQTIMEALRLHELQELVDQLPVAGRVSDFELQTQLPRRQTLQVNAVGLGGNAGKGGALLVFHDVTRLMQLENMRRDFVANVSHELRTPLSMIKGYVETLLDGAKDSPELAEKFLKTIEKHSNRLTLLIEDLLTISSLESGYVTMDLQPVALAGTVDKVLDELRDRANSRDTRVTSHVAPSVIVRADAVRLQQVLFNLVDNAIKYGKTSGQINVHATDSDGEFVRVSVADDGPGIPADAAERVFERFYRVDKARSREQGGTGLGLAIVKHIVQAHGGEVRAELAEGGGAVFSFTLPRGSLVP